MLEKTALSDPLIMRTLEIEYGLQIDTLTFLPLGADPNASVYQALTKGQGSYFVKLKQGPFHDISSVLLEMLHQAGIRQIVPPTQTIHGNLTERIEGFTLIVYPFIEAVDGFHSKLTDRQWIELGRALKQIHETDVPPSIQEQIRKESYSPKWREKVRSLLFQNKLYTDPIALEMAQFMKEKEETILKLVDRAEGLSHRVSNRSSKCVLCHSDIHAGNVLLSKNEALYIIDWDDPILAPKERDLMFIGGGVGNVWNEPREETLFYQGYGKTQIDKELLSYYRHERIVEDIAVYAQELLLNTIPHENRPEMLQQFIDQFAPGGVVEIAYKGSR